MFHLLQVVSALLTVIALTASLAHALELPGKLRLNRDEYLVVQRIYYPGFTIAGIGEAVAPVATAALLFLTPRAGSRRRRQEPRFLLSVRRPFSSRPDQAAAAIITLR